MMRANLAIQIEQQLPIYDNYLDWPKVPEGDSWDSLESYTSNHILNPSKFQSQYVDIIPKSWTVLSLSLSRSHDEISISRVRSGQSPFILTLPMNRHNAQDSEDDCFGFENGKRELQEIINLSNRSAHDTRDMSIKGAKTEWWVTRIALETRLQELLHNMESIWLGGFRGIFSQTVQSPELLLRFQNSLQNILNKHLPSRQKSGRRKKPNFVELDLRVLELFICLGAVTELEDMDEQLMDLLYFVIDILQFHGERNAYDEIDFDLVSSYTKLPEVC